MKKFIQKSTAIFMSLMMIALIGAPAYATESPSQATPTDAEASDSPIISEENILETLESEEFREELEEEGIDVEDFEEKLENGDYVIVEDEEDLKEIFTDEEIEEIRKQNALTAFGTVKENAVGGLFGLIMLPFVPVMLIVPVFGWVTAGVSLMSPILLVTLPFQFIAACVDAVIIYVNFDDSEYRTESVEF